MTQYMVAIHHPDDFEPFSEPETTRRDISALNEEMIAAGVRVFVGGLQPVSTAKAVRLRPQGALLVTDGPYLETKEHIGGFWILECANIDEAMAWAKKGAIACDIPGEVRELLFFPAPE